MDNIQTSHFFPNGLPGKSKLHLRKNRSTAAFRQKELSAKPSAFSWFFDSCAEYTQILKQLTQASNHHIPSLIVGESGCGKEIVAREIHKLWKRRMMLNDIQAPFIAINCGAIPDELAESLLFGHERGAFTSAREAQEGKFETARKGVIFLDEIQNLSLSVQAKLLRVVQDKKFERLGAKETRSVNCKIITASNIPLELLIKKNLFRRDLFYRINISPIYIPPLRKSSVKIPTFISSLLKQIETTHRFETKKITAEAKKILATYTWPGNIREIEHALIHAHINSGEKIKAKDLPLHITGALKEFIKSGDWQIV